MSQLPSAIHLPFIDVLFVPEPDPTVLKNLEDLPDYVIEFVDGKTAERVKFYLKFSNQQELTNYDREQAENLLFNEVNEKVGESATGENLSLRGPSSPGRNEHHDYSDLIRRQLFRAAFIKEPTASSIRAWPNEETGLTDYTLKLRLTDKLYLETSATKDDTFYAPLGSAIRGTAKLFGKETRFIVLPEFIDHFDLAKWLPTEMVREQATRSFLSDYGNIVEDMVFSFYDLVFDNYVEGAPPPAPKAPTTKDLLEVPHVLDAAGAPQTDVAALETALGMDPTAMAVNLANASEIHADPIPAAEQVANEPYTIENGATASDAVALDFDKSAEKS